MFGNHPRGLATLFFTEMWERFSYYGMRALLALFLVASVETGGFGLDKTTAGAIYGLYTALVYLLALPGGWVADRIMGQRQAVFVGGCIIAAGHFSMAIPGAATFYAGLVLIIIGTGLLKPNVSAIVGDLYPDKGAERDAGFSIFYMGINIGAFAGPLVCGFLGEDINWHLGFSAAGFGMILGLIQYKFGLKHLGTAGSADNISDTEKSSAKKLLWIGIGITAAITIVISLLQSSGIIALTLTGVAQVTGWIIVGIAIAYFAFVLIAGGLADLEKKRVIVIFFLFIGAALFWSGFEQAGSSMNFFAKVNTERYIYGESLTGELSSDDLTALQSTSVPDSVVTKLRAIENTPIKGKESFIEVLKKILGDDDAALYRDAILSRLDIAGGSFEITDQALLQMKVDPFQFQGGVPDSIASELLALKNVSVDGKEQFVGLLNKTIGEENTAKYEPAILKYSIFGWEAPASWLQSVNPIFIILLAPVLGALWVWLGARDPSIPAKFAYGLILLGIGFLVMAWGSIYTEGYTKVSPMWLVVTYFLHTTGELCLSPVGLSSITKLSPKHLVGQMMGIWFMGAALGNLIAGLIGGQFDTLPLPELFGAVAIVVAVSGLLFLVFSGPIKKLIGNLKES